jgi:SAM-dependent methyltransferase
MEIYDNIAESYVRQNLSGFKRRVTVDHTFLKYIGEVRGKKVLDLACGDGYYCRPLRRAGAAEVVGVDISERMIALARKDEQRDGLGIRYECIDVLRLPVLDRFDIVLGSFLLHYGSTREELFTMCRNIYANVRDGGRFVGVNSCPERPIQIDKRYDITRIVDGPLKEGAAIRITLYENGKPACAFDNYHWSAKTYEDALVSAGFRDIEWRGLEVSEEGLEKFGAAFWGPYLKQPGVAVFGCVR